MCDDQTLVYDASVRDCKLIFISFFSIGVGKCPRSGCGGASAGTCDQQKGCQCIYFFVSQMLFLYYLKLFFVGNPGYEILPNSPPTKQFCSAKCDEKNFCSGNGLFFF